MTGLLTDADSVRHATLQTRDAIDFLLLVQGHGWMCCVNLSDHSQPIHTSIQALRYCTSESQVDDSLDWLEHLFGDWGLSDWIRNLVKVSIYALGIILCVVVIVPCILQCLQRWIKSVKKILLVQNKGGNMGEQMGGGTESTADKIFWPW